MREAAPDGIDVYFDNVGGDHLDAAFACARNNARFAICGMIGGYNSARAASLPLHHPDHRGADPRCKGFLVRRLYPAHRRILRATWAQWIASGAVKSRETVVDGLENMPDAFLGLFRGANTGKMLVRL